MKAFCNVLAALFLAALIPGNPPALAQTGGAPPFLGDEPDDPGLRARLIADIRGLPDGELDAVMQVTLLCELDRGALSRRENYVPWEKRCLRTEAAWTGKFRQAGDRRMIDAQMRLYTELRTTLSQAAARYFVLKDIVARKAGTRNDVKLALQEALEQRKKLAEISTRILKFFFTLRDLANEARQ